MAITTGRGAAQTLVFGIGSHLKFAEQAVAGTPITDPDAYSKYKVAVNSMTVAPTTTLLTPGVIPPTVEQFKGVPGPITVEGNFITDALPNRQELFFRHLLNAPSASITQMSGDGIGGASQTILTGGSLTYGVPLLPAALDNQIVATQGPIRLVSTLTAGQAGPSSTSLSNLSTSNPLRIKIVGKDYAGEDLAETLTFTSGTGTATTNSYFQSITNITAENGTATLGITGQSTRTGIEISSSANYRQTPGLTVEAVMGRAAGATNNSGHVPNTITDAYLNSFSFNATREDIITYTFGLMAKRFTNAVNPASDTRAWDDSDRTIASGGLYGPGAFATLQGGQTPFAGYGACLYVGTGGNRARFDQVLGCSIDFNNNTQFTPRLCSIYQGIPYNRQRTITVEITLEYHSDDTDFANAYLAARTWEDVEIVLGHRGTGQFPDETRFVIKELQISEYPSMPVESDDFIRQTIRGMALPDQNATDMTDALKVQLFQDGVMASDLGLRDLS